MDYFNCEVKCVILSPKNAILLQNRPFKLENVYEYMESLAFTYKFIYIKIFGRETKS